MSGVVNSLGSVSGITDAGSRSGGGVESDTVMVFHQSAAPTGWTKLTASGTGTDSVNNICLRCVTGNITDGVGGTVAMTTAFTSQSVASHVIPSNQMPSHTHGISVPKPLQCAVNGGPVCHTCGFQCMCSPTSTATGGTAGHTHTAIDLAVKYVDVIIADKD